MNSTNSMTEEKSAPRSTGNSRDTPQQIAEREGRMALETLNENIERNKRGEVLEEH